jgi:hypothetical protein
MKFKSLLFLFVSIPALACPNLAGSYKICHSTPDQDQDASQVTIEQKIINQMMVYEVSSLDPQTGDLRSEIYEADGKIRETVLSDPDNGTVIKTQTTASCDKEILKVRINITIDSKPLAKMTIQLSKTNSQLNQVFRGESMGEPVNYITSCE